MPGLDLHGSHYATLDGKGRVAVPAKLRASLCDGGDTVWLTLNVDSSVCCVWALSAREWDLLKRDLDGGSKLESASIERQRRIRGPAAQCKVDRQGRVLVPQALRDLANLERGEVVWVGVGGHAEIWNRARWIAMLRGDAAPTGTAER